MELIDNISAELQDWEANGAEYALEESQKYVKEITDFNKDQMFRGERADDSAITPSYAPLTIQIKRELGQPYDRVTLEDTGDFKSEFYVDFKDDEFTIYSENEKTAELVEKYGEQIFGLTEENVSNVRILIRPDLFTRFRKSFSL